MMRMIWASIARRVLAQEEAATFIGTPLKFRNSSKLSVLVKAWSAKLVWYRDILRICFTIMGPNQLWVGTLKSNNFGWGKMTQTPCSSNPLNRSGYSSGIQQARNALGRSQECIIMMCKACWYALIWQMKSLLLDWTSGCKICNTTHLKK